MSIETTPIRDLRESEIPNFHDRLAAARRRARWEIGDPNWADMVIRAFLRPESDGQALAEDLTEEPR